MTANNYMYYNEMLPGFRQWLAQKKGTAKVPGMTKA